MASVYHGHNDTFFFDDDAETTFLSENRLRFAPVLYGPHVIVDEIAHNGSKHWYRIAGPLYSLLKEAALKGNLSLYYYDVKQSAEKIKQAIMRGSVDIFAFPTYARMDAAKKMWDSGVVFPIGHSMDVMSFDHVLYRIEYPAKKLFVFSSVLDIYCWLVFFVLLFLVAFTNHFLVREHSVLKNLWFCAMSCLQPVDMFQKGREKFLATLWCLMVVVFMNYYVSQFFSNITMKPQTIIIDSLDDLAKRPGLKLLVSTSSFEFEANKEKMQIELAKRHFLLEATYYEALRPRLTFYRQDKMLNVTFREKVFEKLTKGDIAWAGAHCALSYQTYHFMNGRYRDKLHVAKSGGDWQPIFLSMLSIADFHRELIEKVIVQLCESGIYYLWKQDIVEIIDHRMLAKVKSETVALGVDILWGAFIVMAVMLLLAFVFYFIEINSHKKEVAKISVRRRNQFSQQFSALKVKRSL